MGLLDDVDRLRTYLYDTIQEGVPAALWGSSFKTDVVAQSLGWKKDRTIRALRELQESRFLDVEAYEGMSGSGFMEPDLFMLNNAGIKAHEAALKPNENPAPADLKTNIANDTRDARKVFVIHGRNRLARKELGAFLLAMGLQPLWFGKLRSEMGGTVPIIDVIERGMSLAMGVIALVTPDEFAVMHPAYHNDKERESGKPIAVHTFLGPIARSQAEGPHAHSRLGNVALVHAPRL